MFRRHKSEQTAPGRPRGPTVTSTPLHNDDAAYDCDDVDDDDVDDDDPDDPYGRAKRLAPPGTIWDKSGRRPGDRLRARLRDSGESRVDTG